MEKRRTKKLLWITVILIIIFAISYGIIQSKENKNSRLIAPLEWPVSPVIKTKG